MNKMNEAAANAQMVTKLLFRLLPIQIVLAAVNAVSSIVSSVFASNYVGNTAMTAIGLFGPINMFINAISTMLVGGAGILCGKYMGRNQQDKMQNVFSLDILLATLVGIVITLVLAVLGGFDWSGFLTRDPEVRPVFDQYLIGQALGILPLMIGNQLASFLSLENKAGRTTIASIAYLIVNVAFNFLFVVQMKMEALGLALANSIGLWVFLLIQAQFFISKKSHLRFTVRKLDWKESTQIVRIGVPGAASFGYQTVRGLILNYLIMAYVGSIGISAFAASDSLLKIFWTVPTGMLAVSRMMISVSVGEEDRQTLTDVMRVMFRKFLPLMGLISLCIILCSIPMTRLFYRDPSDPVYMMTVWGLRILPLCMPLSIICMHFSCYGQASDKTLLVHILSIVDGVAGCVLFALATMPFMGMNSAYWASVFNGVCTTAIIFAYAWIKNRHFPKNMEELMVVPENFGVAENERMDLSIRNVEEVVFISQKVQRFCRSLGVDERRSYLAGLFLEEMAGNVVEHGFTKDKKNHSVDVRAAYKDGEVILRIKDDCVPFDPAERRQIIDPDDIAKNVGVRLIYRMATGVDYQNILGMNVLTIRI